MNNKMEIEIIKELYKNNFNVRPDNYDTYCWHPRNVYNLIYSDILQYSFLKLINRNKIQINEKSKILDIGCGCGAKLSYFMQTCATPDNLYGVDLSIERIEIAKELYPNINFFTQDAQELAFENEYFNLTTEFNVIMSILDEDIRNNLAKQMERVTKIGGNIICYDPICKNINYDSHTKGVSIDDLRLYYPNCTIVDKIGLYTKFTTRFVAKYPALAWLCENIPFKTHHIVLLKRIK